MAANDIVLLLLRLPIVITASSIKQDDCYDAQLTSPGSREGTSESVSLWMLNSVQDGVRGTTQLPG